MKLDELVRALSSRPGLSGLTPLTHTQEDPPHSTAAVIEQMLDSLRRKASVVRH